MKLIPNRPVSVVFAIVAAVALGLCVWVGVSFQNELSTGKFGIWRHVIFLFSVASTLMFFLGLIGLCVPMDTQD